MHYPRSSQLRLRLRICLLAIFFGSSSVYDARLLYQQVDGTWQLVAVDDLISDTVPERLAGEYVTLELSAHGTYTQTFAVGNSIYGGTYTINDSNHITFMEQRSPINKSRPPHTVAFQINNDTLILIDIARRTYHRMRP